jgi:hypothetical protein
VVCITIFEVVRFVRLILRARDNRITIHNASWDYEGSEPRHGTRVTSLAEKPYFDPNAPTRREALGLPDN